MTKDIYRNKKDFGHEEFETEFHGSAGTPVPRESKSQTSIKQTGNPRKDKKIPIKDKMS